MENGGNGGIFREYAVHTDVPDENTRVQMFGSVSLNTSSLNIVLIYIYTLAPYRLLKIRYWNVHLFKTILIGRLQSNFTILLKSNLSM